ncbi:MAG: hypothetical protein AAFX57_20900 [Bacteroidota bacterium]
MSLQCLPHQERTIFIELEQLVWKAFVTAAKPTRATKAIKNTQGFTPATKTDFIFSFVDKNDVFLKQVRFGLWVGWCGVLGSKK